MRWKIILLLLTVFTTNSLAGSGPFVTSVIINDTLIPSTDVFDHSTHITRWVGKTYVSGTCNVIFSLLQLYIHPGDTIKFLYQGKLYYPYYQDSTYLISAPCHYQLHASGCDACSDGTCIVDCYFLPDSLENYYLSHFDPAYIDSLKEIADSLASITNYFAEPPSNLFYPNPVNSDLYFKTLFYTKSTVEISIYDMSGKNVLMQNFDTPAGVQTRDIDLSALEIGVYIVNYKAGKTSIVKRIVKKDVIQSKIAGAKRHGLSKLSIPKLLIRVLISLKNSIDNYFLCCNFIDY